jgi:hypothetical protein
MANDRTVEWWDAGHTIELAADPRFPEGRDVDCSLGADLRCTVPLNHPAPGFGAWKVHCNICGAEVAVSAGGNADDPRSVKIACEKREAQKSFL